jgi:threonylcarbamoyladenosine tRNA methylthiotransferase MtaB
LRLSSIEPSDLTREFLATVAAVPAFCAHLHVPLQSGSDEVLAAMGRHYTAEQFAQLIAGARKALPGLAVTTDVIAGFPGETAWQADETRALCERVGFTKLHVFRYSERVGTPAATMPGQVSPAARSERAAALRLTGDALRSRYLAGRIGGEAHVLIERSHAVDDSGARIAVGTSEDYVRVRVDGADVSAGQVIAVRLLRSDGTLLVGEALE